MKDRVDKYRFDFGKNWENYIKKIGDFQINKAIESFARFNIKNKTKKTFLDIGSGSGLFSLAAHKLGYHKVVSFDYDLHSVNATKELKSLVEKNSNWQILQGSVLNNTFLDGLGKFNVVYSWGVLHHTGDMWKAIENASQCVEKNGYLIISIYNKQYFISSSWSYIKLFYNISPNFVRLILEIIYYIYFFSLGFIADIMRFKLPIKRYFNERRGMNFFNDVKDWIGGYPYEYASPEEIEVYLKNLDFRLVKKYTVGFKLGCNEFLFQKGKHEN